MSRGIKEINTISGGGIGMSQNIFNDYFFNDNSNQPTVGKVEFKEIKLDEITPRSINQYKQNRIERLAQSIRNTNNRLIHPITVVKASDLSSESTVIKKFIENGVDISKLKYVIVSGERRYRAFIYLRDEENKKLNSDITSLGDIAEGNPFTTITANILSPKEAKKEEDFYEDSNIESRQLTPVEAILHIKDALKEVSDPESKRKALIDMNSGSEEGIPKSDFEVNKKFRMDRYCVYYLYVELGIEGIAESTIRNSLSIVNKCSDYVVDNIISGSYTANAARNITTLTKEQQNELVDLWNSDRVMYNEKLSQYKNLDSKKKKRIDHIDAKKAIVKWKNVNNRNIEDFKKISIHLSSGDKNKAEKFLKEAEKFTKIMETYEDFFK